MTETERAVTIHTILKGEWAELFLKLQDLIVNQSKQLGIYSKPTKAAVLRFLLKDYFRLTYTLTKVLDILKTKYPEVYTEVLKIIEQSK